MYIKEYVSASLINGMQWKVKRWLMRYLPVQYIGPTFKTMGPIGCPETSVRNYHYSLRNNPEERSSHLLQLFSGLGNLTME